MGKGSVSAELLNSCRFYELLTASCGREFSPFFVGQISPGNGLTGSDLNNASARLTFAGKVSRDGKEIGTAVAISQTGSSFFFFIYLQQQLQFISFFLPSFHSFSLHCHFLLRWIRLWHATSIIGCRTAAHSRQHAWKFFYFYLQKLFI